MQLVDAHTHLDFEEFDADRDEVIARAREAGVQTWVICGSIHEQWDKTEQIARETSGLAILGVHPWFAAELDPGALEPWLQDLGRRSLAAVGEIGLDILHARTEQAHDNQRHALRAQLALAREREMPVVLHCVRAYPELLAILERDGVPRAGGMMHAWSGPADQIERALRLGLHVSFGPLVMRDRARKARESVPLVPDERLLVETDCPNGMPPGETRGEPVHLVQVISALAELRSQSSEHVGRITSDNALRLLPFPDREA
jgi:TatD DNase family protein